MRSRLLLFVLFVTAIFAVGASATLAAGNPILPLSRIHAGLDCTAKTVIQGTTISSFDVHVIDIVEKPGEGLRILVRVSGPAVDSSGIGQGFSGSPVYCPDASGAPLIAGALSEGVGDYGNKVGLVTPIELMLREPVKPPAAARRLTVRAQPLLGPLAVSGLSPVLARFLQQAGRRAGRVVVAAPAATPFEFPLQPLIPGASVAVGYSTGDVAMGAIGTVTYRDGLNVYAFGHPLDGAGRRSLLLQDAYVYDVVNNPEVLTGGSYKLAAPGRTVGTLTSDVPNAVIGQVGRPPPLIPVNVVARDLDTGKTLALNSQVADETDIDFPNGVSGISLVAPLSVAQAAIEIYDGAPANESGHVCLRVDLRESKLPLAFCNRYVGIGAPGGSSGPPALAAPASNDISSALGLLDQVQFAKLHVLRVGATVDARRGLDQARIVKAGARRWVKARHNVQVALLVRLYRGPERTIDFRLRIPPGLHGTVEATLRGPDSAAPSSAATAITNLASALGGPPAPGPVGVGPQSIAALRKAFAGVPTYDGLKVSFGKGMAKPAYRDPKVVILGQATLRFVVGR